MPDIYLIFQKLCDRKDDRNERKRKRKEERKERKGRMTIWILD
jgi:hypothetical protein